MRTPQVGWLLAAFLCVAAVPALAQQGTSEIGGRVTDEQGGILPGVTVLITNEATGVFREVVSGSDGSYFASQLTPGRYRLTAKLPSFKSFERGGLLLAVGKTLTIDVALAVGGLEETVRVIGESPLVDTTSVKVGGNIGSSPRDSRPRTTTSRWTAATTATMPLAPVPARRCALRSKRSRNSRC